MFAGLAGSLPDGRTGVFQGSSRLSLDAKGRLSMPTRHRDALQSQCEGRLTLTRHPQGCLMVYPRPVWEKRREQLVQMPEAQIHLQRILLGSATDVELDAAGRILVSPELREAAGLERDAMLLGMGNRFELWDTARLAAREAEDLANWRPGAGAGFTF